MRCGRGFFAIAWGNFFAAKGQIQPSNSRHFLFYCCCTKRIMQYHVFRFVKTLVKSSLDNYVLPGTLTGSEILWLYLTQWKRDIASIVFASYFLSAQNVKSRTLSAFLPSEQLEDPDPQVAEERS
jgi:hypothetical protein